MGKASRWLRNLLRRKKTPPQQSKEKRTWGIIQSFREKPHATPLPELAPIPCTVAVDEDEQSKRAIAVAAATAAAAEAAVAAAQAAAAVVKLTSKRTVKGRGWAAVMIQAAFRGYLARRALRALKGLVKLQALVRGNIVRKQAAETLRCMQALVRVQARTRACRALQSEKTGSQRGAHLHAGPPTPEKHEQTVQEIVRQHDISGSVKRNSMKPAGVDTVAEWNWLDKWMEDRYWDTREATRRAGVTASADDDKNVKILEVDPGKQQFIHKKRSNHQRSSCSTVNSDQNGRSFASMPETPPSKDSTTVQQSVPSPASVEMQQCLSPLRITVEPGDCVETPQFYSAKSRHGSSRRGPFTPAKSECSRSLFSGYADYPSYMANTESYLAKVRSQSAQKQRSEFQKSNSTRRTSSHGMIQNPSAAMSHQPSSLHSKFANKAYPGSGRLDRLGMPVKI